MKLFAITWHIATIGIAVAIAVGVCPEYLICLACGALIAHACIGISKWF